MNSKVAQSLKKYDLLSEERSILSLRAEAKVICTEENVECNIMEAPCLFNIKKDPCERKNLANDPAYSDIFQDLKNRLDSAVGRIAKARNKAAGKPVIFI
jgi:hypothetical protein